MSVKEKPTPAPTITEQLINFLSSPEAQRLNSMQFGEIKFTIRNGNFYNVLISDSILVKSTEPTK